jgi:Acetyltransferase (GNAT) domain
MFRLPANAASIDPQHLAWKYWSDRGDSRGPRSFTARHDGRIVAHVAAWPSRIRLPDRVLPAAHLIDWASDPRYPGSGIWLLRHVGAKIGLLIATGGTEITRRTLPVLGFRPVGDVCGFARPVRPFAQARTTNDRTWRLPARLVRNSLWHLSPSMRAPRGWSAMPVEPDDIPASLWPQPSASIAVMARDADLYRYIVASPSTRHELFGIRRGGEWAGYFCVAFARHVARIADLWVASTEIDDWRAAFQTAADRVAREPDVYEITAWASTTPGRHALLGAGFRLRDSATLSVLGDSKILDGRELHVQMLDCDASFLGADEISYLT